MTFDQANVNNFGVGRGGQKPKCFVIHIMQGSFAGTRSWFKNPNSVVSAHYLVSKVGEVVQMVDTENWAYTNGLSFIGSQCYNVSGSVLSLDRLAPIIRENFGINPNLYSISIENEGKTGEVFTDAMYKSIAEIIKLNAKRYNIPIDRKHVIGHNGIDYISRSNCPGTGFSFDKLFTYLEDMNFFTFVDPAWNDALDAYYKQTRSDYAEVKRIFGTCANHFTSAGAQEIAKFLTKFEDSGVMIEVMTGRQYLASWVLNFSKVSYSNRNIWGTSTSLSQETETRLRSECQNQTQALKLEIEKLTEELKKEKPIGDYALLANKIERIQSICEE